MIFTPWQERKCHYVFDARFTKLLWWEKIVLAFCTLHVMDSEYSIIEFKVFLDRFYLYRLSVKLPNTAANRTLGDVGRYN